LKKFFSRFPKNRKIDFFAQKIEKVEKSKNGRNSQIEPYFGLWRVFFDFSEIFRKFGPRARNFGTRLENVFEWKNAEFRPLSNAPTFGPF